MAAFAQDAAGSPEASGTGRSFHVDCDNGTNDANGRRPWTAWRTLERANAAQLRPGDSLLLLRGCRWLGPLNVSWSGTAEAPITIGAYGEGPLPIVEDSFQDILVTGSWFVIQDVHVRADAPTRDVQCDGQRAGVRYGIFVDAGSQYGVIRDILATELNTGVRIARGASYHQILDSVFRNNSMKSDDPKSDAGAVAVDLQGDHNEVARNRISGSDACSRFFGGRDGSAISIYGGRHNVIHHNRSRQNHDFIELGDPRTQDTLIAYNVDHSTLDGANFAVVHGLGSRYGPVRDTRIIHNTAVVTGRGATGILCSHVLTGEDLQVIGNIVWGDGDAVTCQDGFIEADNIYWASDGSPSITFELGPTSRIVDPRLVDAQDGDLQLLSDSPAIDAIRPVDLGAIGTVDAAGVAVPQGYAPDIGAYEFTVEAPPSPTPDPFQEPSPTPSPGPVGTGEEPSGSPLPGASVPVTPVPTATPLPTPTPRATPPPGPRPSASGTVLPPTGGSGALDQLIVLVAVLSAGGLLAAVVLARRSPA